MAAGDVSIANRALSKLGEARITDFTDDSKAGRAVNATYTAVRDAELRRHKWRFSITRTQLAASATTPDFGYARAFPLPTDCLRVLAVGDWTPGVDTDEYRDGHDRALYSLEGRSILTDLGAPLNLRYVARIQDPSQFDPAFAEALASRLAYELAEELTGSGSLRDRMLRDYKAAVSEAILANALETAPETFPDDSWIAARG